MVVLVEELTAMTTLAENRTQFLHASSDFPQINLFFPLLFSLTSNFPYLNSMVFVLFVSNVNSFNIPATTYLQ